MKSVLCFCIPFALLFTGSAQPPYFRPHPLYNGQQYSYNNNNNLLALALIMGFDFNDYLALQASRQSPAFGMGNLGWGLGDFGIQRPGAQRRAQQRLNTLSMLGIIDGPDVPDGPPAKQGGAKRGGAKAKAAAAGEAQEGAPVKKPRRGGPRRRPVKAKAAKAKK